MAKYRSNQRELGDAVVSRLKEAGLSGDAKKAAAVFKSEQAALADASDAANEARIARDDALEVVSKADVALDAQISRLADRMAGKRSNPFAAFSPVSPSELQGLPTSRELVELRKLGRNLARAKPPAAVTRALDACLALGADVQKALDRFARPQNAYAKALARRDALLLPWGKALNRLKILARAALVDDPTRYRALVAPPGVKVKRRRKRKKAAPVTE